MRVPGPHPRHTHGSQTHCAASTAHTCHAAAGRHLNCSRGQVKGEAANAPGAAGHTDQQEPGNAPASCTPGGAGLSHVPRCPPIGTEPPGTPRHPVHQHPSLCCHTPPSRVVWDAALSEPGTLTPLAEAQCEMVTLLGPSHSFPPSLPHTSDHHAHTEVSPWRDDPSEGAAQKETTESSDVTKPTCRRNDVVVGICFKLLRGRKGLTKILVTAARHIRFHCTNLSAFNKLEIFPNKMFKRKTAMHLAKGLCFGLARGTNLSKSLSLPCSHLPSDKGKGNAIFPSLLRKDAVSKMQS